MPTPFEKLSELDKLIHEPSRLAILTALASVQSADFMYLQRITALNRGNLSTHLAKLETAELVGSTNEFVDRRPRTELRLTERGRRELVRYWEQLDRLRQDAQAWEPHPEDHDRVTPIGAEGQLPA